MDTVMNISPPTVRHFLHAICVPFALRRSPGPNAGVVRSKGLHLDEIASCIRAPWERTDPFEMTTEVRSDTDLWNALHPMQALAYFHPHVRPLLGDPERVRCWRHRDIHSLRVELRHGPWSESLKDRPVIELRLPVLRCQLWVFQPDIGLLMLELGEDRPRPLDEVQALLDTLRRLHAPYVDQSADSSREPRWFGGHCPKRVELLDREGRVIGSPGDFECQTHAPAEVLRQFGTTARALRHALEPDRQALAPLAAHWRSLLAPLRTGDDQPVPEDRGQLDVCLLGDDRAPIMNWLSFDDVRLVGRGDWVRTCFADAPGSDRLPYAQGFLADFEKRHAYDRFWYEPTETTDHPSRVLMSGYAFTYAGNADCHYFFANEKNGAHAIFRHIHVPMGLIAHMQKARLLRLAQQLSDIAGRDRRSGQLTLPPQREIEDIYLQFIEFTQTGWFDEVTPQEQGQQLFAMWQRELGTARLYEQMRQSLRDLYDYSELRSDRELNQSVAWFGLIALALSILAVVTGLYGMNVPEGNAPSPAEGLPGVFWGVSGVGLLCSGAAARLAWRMFRRPDRRPR